MSTMDPTTRGRDLARDDGLQAEMESFYLDPERFRLAMLATRDVMRDCDLLSNSQYWNNAIYTSFGYSPGDIDPTIEFWRSRIHADDIKTITHSLQAAINNPSVENWSQEYSFCRNDGSYVYVLDRSHITRNTDGTAIRLLSVMFDISDRKTAGEHYKQALNTSEEHFRLLTEAIPQQVWTAGPDGALNYVNRRVTDYFGAPAEEVLGTGWTEAVHPDDLQNAIQRWKKSLKTGEPYGSDFRLKRADGVYRWHIAMALPLRDTFGEIAQWFGTSTDITSHKDIEAALLEGKQNLAEAQARAKIGSWRRDLITKEGQWSEEMYRIFGLDPALPPPSFHELAERIHADDRQTFTCHYNTFLNEGNSYQLDARLPQPDGSFLWIEARSETIRDENGRTIKLIGTVQDITERKLTESALSASELRFGAFMEKTPILAFIKDVSGKFVYINPTFERVFDITLEEIIGKTVFDYWPLEVAQKVDAHDATIYDSDQQVEAYEDVPTKDGMRHWFSVKFAFTNAEGERFMGATAIDVTDRYRAEQALRTSSDLLETSQSIAKLGGWELDIATQQVTWTNESYRLHDAIPGEFCPTLEGCIGYLIGESRERFVAALDIAIHYGEGFDMEVESVTTKGRMIDVRVNCSATIVNNRPVKLTGIFQDISEQKAAQNALEIANSELGRTNAVLKHIAHYDPLTHLPNRVLLADRMQQAMIHNQRHEKSLAVAFLDLDGFKAVNDQHGHSVGDALLITLSQRIRAALREGDTLARIGGDEFVAVLTDLKESSDCEPLLQRLLQAIAEPVIYGNVVLEVSASIGVTIYPQDGVDAEHLLRHADQAMYLAKQAGKNCYHLFDVARDVAVKNQRESLEHIRHALHNQEFVVFYQPKVNMRTGAVIGAEALLRWQHPERGLLPPAAFLRVIEDNPISIEVGEWVIATALTQIADWQNMGLHIPISVNIGALQLQQNNFATRLKELLASHPQTSPSSLELEILETSALEDITQVSAAIKACQLLGVTFALDDFGTGYSSLTYLKRLPAKLLKIDQSFVRDMLEDPDDLAIIKGIIGLATAFRRNVIAEGVETIAHGEMLLSIGCELAQGYGIARPMPAANIPDWVKTWQPDQAWSKGCLDC